jgi:aconitate hydratase
MTEQSSARTTLTVGDREYEIFSLSSVEGIRLERLPYSLKILLENLLRHEDGANITRDDILALANWQPSADPDQEIAFTPARVILQDFTGVPAVVDLAAMRDAVVRLGGDADAINPLSPAELVIDHSVQVDNYGSIDALALNNEIEFERNRERYEFLRWGQNAFENFRVVPPNTGIVHQVNLEHLARVVFDAEADGVRRAYPDTVVGTDSHTTMINGLGVLGWGVGGIEAEAAMLGQPITMLIPQVIGFRLTGSLREGATATDLVLTVTEILRDRGVVGKFVEFFGDGLANLPLADRATLGNMSPEFGSTCAIFPVDAETIRYLELSGRDPEHIRLVEAYAKAQGMWRENGQPDAEYTEVIELDMGDVVPSISGPRRPQDRILLSEAKSAFAHQMQPIEDKREHPRASAAVTSGGRGYKIQDGAVLIAAITSCTNTSNPAVMIAAGLVARNARKRGLKTRPWVKTSLAPGSKVVTEYLKRSGLLPDLEALGFSVVGYGCTTCIGNSGPLRPEIAEAVSGSDIVGTSVLSGNRNFEGRIHPLVRMNYLASPPLVVAYALAGTMDIDLMNEPLGKDDSGAPVYLKDIWPSSRRVHDAVMENIDSAMFRSSYDSVFRGDENWRALPVPEGSSYEWNEDSTYVRNPPYFDGMGPGLTPVEDIHGSHIASRQHRPGQPRRPLPDREGRPACGFQLLRLPPR